MWMMQVGSPAARPPEVVARRASPVQPYGHQSGRYGLQGAPAALSKAQHPSLLSQLLAAPAHSLNGPHALLKQEGCSRSSSSKPLHNTLWLPSHPNLHLKPRRRGRKQIAHVVHIAHSHLCVGPTLQ